MDEDEPAKALFCAGLDCFDAGDYAAAEARFREALALAPERPSILANLAGAVLSQGRPDEALALAESALMLDADSATALATAATAGAALGRLEPALAAFDRLVTLSPDDIEVWAGRGDVLAGLARWPAALASYDQALAVDPSYAAALASRGNVLKQLGRLEEALASYDRALALQPDTVAVLSNRGVVLHELRRSDEALASFDRALALVPDHVDALANRAVVLMRLRQFDEALAGLDGALARRPDYPEALSNRAIVLVEMKRLPEALVSVDRALALRPHYGQALHNRGIVLQKLGRLEEALASFERALAVQPDLPYAFSSAAECVLDLGDWDRLPEFARGIEEHVRGRKSTVLPFLMLGYSGDPALQQRCAETYAEREFPPRAALWRSDRYTHDRIRVAYISADFRQHPLSQLTAELYELHDRGRFEVIGISLGADDGSRLRARLVAAFDRFHDVRTVPDGDVAALLADMRVDIAVDLTGYTDGGRPGILVSRPAPVQVSYMGFPATMGAPFLDYIIADPIVAPHTEQANFSERIVQLPETYWICDSKRVIVWDTPSRTESGLPEEGFVFCCFNNAWKITPEIFDVWARLLHAVEGSVLWLLQGNPAHDRNLRRRAERLGLDPARVIFAPRQPPQAHFARQRLADLFLDTLPYNAHTTASDALSAGLPVVTCQGRAFASRVASSILKAAGLPEMVTTSLAEYETLARDLALDPGRLGAIKARLAANRATAPLFDSRRFTRHLEAAYIIMWERARRGEPPESFSVSPIDAP